MAQGEHVEEPVMLYFVGTAGSGKTVLTGSFSQWMENSSYDTVIVNLDPGAEELPYQPEIDIRDWLRLSDIQAEYGLGPNGAQILCADLLVLNIEDIKNEIDKIDTDYVLIDTPGQIELFAFRESSRILTDTLGRERSMIAFLFDSMMAKQPSGLVTLFMLCATLQFRFSIPSINLLSKSDMLEPSELETIIGWSNEPTSLMSALAESTTENIGTKSQDEEIVRTEGYTGNGAPMQAQLNMEFFKAMETLGTYKALTPVSAKTMTGLEDLYNTVQQAFAGGEDLDKR